jgi:hypothetical protein
MFILLNYTKYIKPFIVAHGYMVCYLYFTKKNYLFPNMYFTAFDVPTTQVILNYKLNGLLNNSLLFSLLNTNFLCVFI